MLTIFGQKNRFCDGVNRRSFLKIGALGLGASALTLADVFRAEAKAGTATRPKAVINIFLGGGPPHQDLWEIKTEAPAEIRGEFKPIATRVPGIHISELLPRLAALTDKVALVRSLVGLQDEHSSYQNLTGFPMGVGPWSLSPMAEVGFTMTSGRPCSRAWRFISSSPAFFVVA